MLSAAQHLYVTPAEMLRCAQHDRQDRSLVEAREAFSPNVCLVTKLLYYLLAVTLYEIGRCVAIEIPRRYNMQA